MGLAESFRVLGTARAPGAAPALTQVLWASDPRLALHAAEALLTNPTPRGTRVLVTGFPRLHRVVQEAVAARLYRIRDEIRSAVVSNDPGRRAGALELLTFSTSTDIMPLVCNFFSDPSPLVRTRALDAYVAAASRFAEEFGGWSARASRTPDPGPPTGTALQMAERLSAVRQSLVTALGELRTHRDLRVVAAALAMGEPAWDALGEALRRGGDVPGGNRQFILLHLLDDETPDAARFLFWLLGHRQAILRRQAARVFAQREPGFARAATVGVLRELEPAHIRKLVRLNRGFPWMLPLEGRMTGVFPEIFLLLFTELEKVAIEPRDRAVWLRILAECPDAAVGDRALEALSRLPVEDACTQFVQLVGSQRDSVALAAISYLGRTGRPELARAVAPRINSENPELAAMSRRVVARRSFASIIERWDALGPETRESVGRTIMLLDPDAALLLLPEFGHGEGIRRARAAHMAAVLGVVPKLRLHIVRLADDPSPRARATAISALGQLADPGYFRDLLARLGDVDQRVRANLIEALGATRHAGFLSHIEPFLDAPILRQRVNAAVAFVRIGEEARGLSLLESWMQSPDPAIRTAAAYGLGATGLAFCLGVLSDALASERHDPAKSMISRSLARLTSPAPNPGTPDGGAP